jgi:hypothetical protein
MDRAIFDMNLGVEATSLYILACAIIDQGEIATLERIRGQWNASEDDLLNGLKTLIRHNVISAESSVQENGALHINPKGKWRRS